MSESNKLGVISLSNGLSIIDHFSNSDDILKGGKPAQIGEIRVRANGVKERKTNDGWELVGDPKDKSVKTQDQVEIGRVYKEAGTGRGIKKLETGKWVYEDNGEEWEEKSTSQTPTTKDGVASLVQKILSSPGSNKSKMISLWKMGLRYDEIVNYSGFKLSDIKWHTKGIAQDGLKDDNKLFQQIQNNTESLLPEEMLPEISVKDRWDSYKMFGEMLCMGIGKSTLAYGSGGVGKTYTMMGEGQIFDQHSMKGFDEDVHITTARSIAEEKNKKHVKGSDDEDDEEVEYGNGLMLDKDNYDYIKITGKVSPIEMYKKLFEHNGKVVVFDDCDSVLGDEDSVNILKGALDTSGDGTIEYATKQKILTMYENIPGVHRVEDNKGNVEYNIPKRFKFKGQVLFISNLTTNKIPQALLSRSQRIDLTMNADETVDMMETLKYKVKFQDKNGNPIDVSKEDRDAAFDFLKQYRKSIPMNDLNIRTFIKIALMKKVADERGGTLNWKTAAAASLKSV